MVSSKLADLQRMISRIRNMSRHEAFYLIKNCLFIPKLLFVLRSSPLYNLNKLDDMDKCLYDSLSSLLNISLDENKKKQISLPVKLGGFGIRSLKDLALPAFLSSSYGSSNIINIISPSSMKNDPYSDATVAEEQWKNLPGITESDFPQDPSIQQLWDMPICKVLLKNLINNTTSVNDCARFNAITQEHSSDWLNALPSVNLGLKLNDSQFRIACALRLGAKICHSHKCVCGKEVSSDGIHGLSCKNSAGRHPRHSACNDIIKRSLCSADISATREPLGVSRVDGKRPDGMSLFPWKNGKCLLWDFTCSDTLAPSYVDGSANKAGKAAKEGEDRKIKHYSYYRIFLVLGLSLA